METRDNNQAQGVKSQSADYADLIRQADVTDPIVFAGTLSRNKGSKPETRAAVVMHFFNVIKEDFLTNKEAERSLALYKLHKADTDEMIKEFEDKKEDDALEMVLRTVAEIESDAVTYEIRQGDSGLYLGGPTLSEHVVELKRLWTAMRKEHQDHRYDPVGDEPL
eukprot:TRINITY_DN3006_c0_g1_i5.p2 TRINITY_DN3006_c0_g1~~TRINITY_DN3006_c0_g1_i5.p2  ORF type:complete len:165 (-),score=27.62 TRINITY_DN3006_c0_g1_i5:1403-1897(-)